MTCNATFATISKSQIMSITGTCWVSRNTSSALCPTHSKTWKEWVALCWQKIQCFSKFTQQNNSRKCKQTPKKSQQTNTHAPMASEKTPKNNNGTRKQLQHLEDLSTSHSVNHFERKQIPSGSFLQMIIDLINTHEHCKSSPMWFRCCKDKKHRVSFLKAKGNLSNEKMLHVQAVWMWKVLILVHALFLSSFALWTNDLKHFWQWKLVKEGKW